MPTALLCNVFSQVLLPKLWVFCPQNCITSVAGEGGRGCSPLCPPLSAHMPMLQSCSVVAAKPIFDTPMKTAPCIFHIKMLLVVSLSVTSRALDISHDYCTTMVIFTQCLVYERKIIFCREPDLLEGFMLVLWEPLKVLEIWPRKYRKVMFISNKLSVWFLCSGSDFFPCLV